MTTKFKKIFSNPSILVHSATEMQALGKQIAETLEPGTVIGLVGSLGAGKTQLVQGILQGMSCHDSGSSPTFSIIHEHRDGRLPLCHFDFYRLNNEEELMSIGWDDYLASEDILLVEWANLFDGSPMPADTLWLHLEHKGEQQRLVTLVL